MIKNGVILTLLKILSSGLGFLLTILMAHTLGANQLTDVLMIAMFIPVNLTGQLPGLLGITLVPPVVESHVGKGDPDLQRLFMGYWIMVLMALWIAVCLLTPGLMRMMAPGIPDEALGQGERMLLILSPCIVLMGLFSSGQAFLNSQRKFFAPEIGQVAYRAISILCLVTLSARWGVMGLIFGLLLGTVVQFLIVAQAGRRYGIATLAAIPPHWRNLERIMPVLKVAGVVAVSFALDQANLLVDRFFTSFMEPGSISILSYADRLAKAVPLMLAASLFSLLLPELSHRKAMNGDLFGAVRVMVLVLLAIGLPLAILVVWGAQDIVGLVLNHGHFKAELAGPTSMAIIAFAVGIPAIIVGMGLQGLYFVERNLRQVLRIGATAFVLKAATDLAFFKLGVAGIALSSTVTVWIITITIWIHLRIGIPHLGAYARLLAACLIMGVILYLIPWGGLIADSRLFRLTCGGLSATLFYLALVSPLVRELRHLAKPA